MATSTRWDAAGWNPVPGSAARGAARAGGGDALLASMLEENPDAFRIEQAGELRPASGRGAVPRAAAVTVESDPGESYVLAVRHPSGALTFHPPMHQGTSRGPGPTRQTLHFEIEIAPAESGDRRGLFSAVAKFFLLKIAKKVTSAALPVLAKRWERARWKKRKRNEGWLLVTRQSLKDGALLPLSRAGLRGRLAEGGPNLLLIHGILSDAETAFRGLAVTGDGGGFFPQIGTRYRNIFAFDHFTISKSPEENARELLRDLPETPAAFDVITHSRGGIVLRHLTEGALGADAARFSLGRAVLVAAPNEGSPLGHPSRLVRFLEVVANVSEVFSNPFTDALSLIAEALGWIAERLTDDLPGVHGVGRGTEPIERLLDPPACPEKYAAIAANYEPDGPILRRFADLGIDLVFGCANDLVVPTEGTWRVDRTAARWIDGSRIACYGPAGNFAAFGDGKVMHTNFFYQPETIRFLVEVLKGDTPTLPFPQDTSLAIPYTALRARSVSGFHPGSALATAGAERDEPSVATRPVTAEGPEDVFHLLLLRGGESRKGDEHYSLVARYGNALVVTEFHTKNADDGTAGRTMQRIIQVHERIKNVLAGKATRRDGTPMGLPVGEELLRYGTLLFETLFPGDIRRLYDIARSRRRGERLSLVFTSTLDWIADKPWEFAFDPASRAFLATEEVNFTRNVFTANPSERIVPRRGALRILVASAQPIGAIRLSVEEEENVIRRGFQVLIDAGLAEVKIVRATTPAALHQHVSLGEWDVVHFIGHGEFDAPRSTGFLLFEDDLGIAQRVDSRTIREILCNRGIRLVFLNACETGRGGMADFNRGVAPALVAGGIPAVVANQYSVLDASATAFARRFYWALAQGISLGDAAREARIAVNYQIEGESIDWAVPVIFARDPSERMTERVDSPVPYRDVRGQAQRTLPSAKAGRVAIWDLNAAFPTLESLADRMNAVQRRFVFEVVDVSAPLGSWRLRRDEGESYLDAEDIGARLGGKARDLRVDLLVCITSLPLRAGSEVNVWYWGSDTGAPIAILSTAPLEAPLSRRGLPMERALVNGLVGALAAELAGVNTHGGLKTCPLSASFDPGDPAPGRPMLLDHRCVSQLRKTAGAGFLTAVSRILEMDL